MQLLNKARSYNTKKRKTTSRYLFRWCGLYYVVTNSISSVNLDPFDKSISQTGSCLSVGINIVLQQQLANANAVSDFFVANWKNLCYDKQKTITDRVIWHLLRLSNIEGKGTSVFAAVSFCISAQRPLIGTANGI